MRNDLALIIDRLRTGLLKSPDSVVIGKIKDAAVLNENAKTTAGSYREVLHLFDGARCGAIDLWSYADLSQHQFRVSGMEGGSNTWLEIGQVLYEPLLLNHDDYSVYLFNTDEEQVCFLRNNLQSFLKNDVFGPGYAKPVPDCEQDEWYLFFAGNGSRIASQTTANDWA